MLGSEMGQHTDHVPLPTLSQEAVTQAPFLHSSCTIMHLILFRFCLPSFFPYSKHPTCNATHHRHMPPALPLIPLTTISRTPPSPPLPASMPPQTLKTTAAFTLLPRTSTPMPHISPFFPFAFISPCLCLAVLSVPPSTHLAVIALQCGLRTPSPLENCCV
jgi:hypothetical protein